ncbi:hypothetical protein AB6C40_00795 [Vibrio splendidus]
MDIFATPLFVAIAWICTVVSCVYAFVQKSNVTKITQKFDNLSINHKELKVENTTLEQKIVEIEKNDIHDNYQEVHQNGQTNFNQGVIKGDFVYNK